MPRPRKWRRRFAWALGILVALGLTAYAVMTWLMWQWVAQPPPLDADPSITQLQPETRGERVTLGRNWLGTRDSLPVLYLTGSAFDMGYANGVLTQSLIHRQEDAVLGMMRQVAPYRPIQFLLKFFVVYKNRHLPDHITPALQLEILGMSRGCKDTHPDMGPYYNRLLNYHAAQDISYMLMNSPLLRGGCTAFGAWGSATRDGHLLAGRNFDWEAAPVFDRDRLVILCEPDDGIPFVSLSWAGMAGVVSGLNREGLCITLNGAPSELPGAVATPGCLLAREVLQFARNLDEAVAILRKRSVFVSTLFLVGSRQDGRFVVVEKTPDRTEVRDAADRPLIVCPNHYFTAALTNTALNALYLRNDTSASRQQRAEELLGRSLGRLDPAATATILRDRRLPGDRAAGNGHRGSLNPLIATHAVIMDLTSGTFWAAKPPHQLGAFVAFDVAQPDRALPDATLPPDAILASGEYDRTLAAHTALNQGWLLLERNDLAGALDQADRADRDNPGFYRVAWLRAAVHAAAKRWAQARDAADLALAGQPALGGERTQIERLHQNVVRQLEDHPAPPSTPAPAPR